MIRPIAAFLALAATGAVAAADSVPQKRWYNLDRPGALEELQQRNPEHYAKVESVMRAAETLPCETPETRALKVSHQLREFRCGALIKTSLPPKRHVFFVLEDVSYHGNITMQYDPGRVMKAHERY